LLIEGTKSNLHQLGSDEMWHFYLGGPLHLAQIHPDGRAEQVLLGSDINQGQQLQCIVTAGTWFGAYPDVGSAFSFVGCTVAPGFEYADFELASRRQLLDQYPHAKDLIERLTKL
jgi:predicted cupin superfamily sugar epimerase